MQSTAEAQRQSGEFPAYEGIELFYRAWLPPGPVRRAVILVHRGHEHSGRFEGVVDALSQEGTGFFSFDMRGHGNSPGERGWAESFSVHARDLDAFARFVGERFAISLEDMAVVGVSIGGVVAAQWVHDYAPTLRGMVLVAPAFAVRLYIPFARVGLRLLRRVRTRPFIKSYVTARMLTHDPREVARYENDALISKQIAVNILLEMHETARRLVEDAAAVETPAFVLAAGCDRVVAPGAQRRFFENLGTDVKSYQTYSGLFHDLLHERGRDRILSDISEFLSKRFSTAAPRDNDTTPRSASVREEELLRRPLPLFSPRRYAFVCARASMRSLGSLSEGVRIGWRRGFDSGESLDHVYRNMASGSSFLGRWIDRAYLNAIGWRGIRARKENVRRLLDEAITRAEREGCPIRILDVACGGGRYALEAAAAHRAGAISLHLCDWSESALAVAADSALALGLEDIRFERRDAFDGAGTAKISPGPSIAIVSGLYELFPDNEAVLRSLRGIAGAIEEGGYLIYTNQPWHPQVEFIARVLPNREGKPWIMRRRSQAEMDALVRAAGLNKVKTLVDEWGIFTVSLARK